MFNFTCQQCLARFSRRWRGESESVFCSRLCFHESLRKTAGTVKVCPTCHRKFELLSGEGDKQHCSRECWKRRIVDTESERFWKKVRKSKGCWTWTGSKSRHGYGQLRTGRGKGRLELAPRISWRLANGPIPDGLCVLHKCDNPPCVRPSHLKLGTMADNSADMVRKGRHVIAKDSRPDSTTLTLDGVTLRISAWSKRLNIGVGTIRFRLAHGFSVKEALNTVDYRKQKRT